MIVFGSTKRELEFLLYLGITDCLNCQEISHFGLYRVVRKASVYFIPVAKWGKACYVICDSCTAGLEISQEQKACLLQECRSIPEASRYKAIWNSLCQGWDRKEEQLRASGSTETNFKVLQAAAEENACKRFPSLQVDFVFDWSFVVTQLRRYGVLGQVDIKHATLQAVAWQ